METFRNVLGLLYRRAFSEGTDHEYPNALVAGIGRGNRSIGKAGGLLRRVPDDMHRFAAKTIGKPVIMGRKTFESVIALCGRPLVNRPNIVLSRDPAYQHVHAIVCRSLASALLCAAAFAPEEIHIGGGPELYDQVIDQVDRLYLTLFNDDHEGEANSPASRVSSSRSVGMVSGNTKGLNMSGWITYAAQTLPM